MSQASHQGDALPGLRALSLMRPRTNAIVYKTGGIGVAPTGMLDAVLIRSRIRLNHKLRAIERQHLLSGMSINALFIQPDRLIKGNRLCVALQIRVP